MSEEEIGVDVVIENEEGVVDATSDVLKGDKGEKGDPTATIEINDVITGEEGTEAKIENVGTDVKLKLNITIPRGDKGDQGIKGDTPQKGTDYFTEEEIQEIKSNILDQVNQFSVLVVEELPTENIDDHTIYFIPKATAEQNDVYDEYIYINNDWEHIGTTEVDLSSYYKKEEIDTKLSEVEGNEVYIGKAEEAPSSAKIIVEDEDFGEGAGLSKAEVYVGAEEPVAGEKVWFRKSGKNRFNGILSLGSIHAENGTENNNSTTAIRSNFIEVDSNTVYTLSSVDKYNHFIVYYDKVYKYINYFAKEKSINTFTTPENCKYIRFTTYMALEVTDTTTKFQLEQNTKATTYEDYREPQIRIRNSDGVYEKFM